MRRLLFACLLMPFWGISQVNDPVKWSFTAKNAGPGVYEIHLTAAIQSGWHTYSQTTPDGGPVPTAVSFTNNPLIKLNGAVMEVGNMQTIHSTIFGVDVKQYSEKVDFVQKIQVKGKAKTSVTGTVEYMTCDDRQCLPPKSVPFSVTLN